MQEEKKGILQKRVALRKSGQSRASMQADIITFADIGQGSCVVQNAYMLIRNFDCHRSKIYSKTSALMRVYKFSDINEYLFANEI